MTTVSIKPRGAFRLAESIRFGFGQRAPDSDGEVMRLGFVLDGYATQVGAAVRQQPSGTVDVEVVGAADSAAVARQVARVLSLDVDATGWDRLCQRDPLLTRLQQARPGLRPPLFYSAYEALAWAVLSARRPVAQMAAVRDRLATEYGAVLDVAGKPMPVLPSPEQLLTVKGFAGLPEVKIRRLHGVARAAADGELDTETLRALPPADAGARVRKLAGIGPFYAQLVTVRTLGHTDVLPTGEPHVLSVLGQLLGRDSPVAPEEFERLADGWSPWRTWATVAIRAAGPLLLGDG